MSNTSGNFNPSTVQNPSALDELPVIARENNFYVSCEEDLFYTFCKSKKNA